MARKITIDIKTTANLDAIKQLSAALKVLQTNMRSFTATAKGFSDAVRTSTAQTKNFQKAAETMARSARKVSQEAKSMSSALVPLQTNLARVASASTTANTSLARLGRGMPALAASTRNFSNAVATLTTALERLSRANPRGGMAWERLFRLSSGGMKQISSGGMAAIGAGGGGPPGDDYIDAVYRIIPQMRQLTTSLQQGATAWQRFMATIRMAGTGLVGIGASIRLNIGVALRMMGQTLQQITSPLRTFITLVSTGLGNALRFMGQSLRVTGTELRTFVSLFSTAFGNALRSGLGAIRQFAMSGANLGTLFRPVIPIIQNVAQTLRTLIPQGVNAAGNSIRSFASAGIGLFRSLGAAVNGTGSIFRTFAGTITGTLANAQRSIREFYSAGWSLLVSGRMMQNFGQGILSGGMGSLDQYMDYEKGLMRTAVSAATLTGEGESLQVAIDPGTIQDLIFGLQRGTIGGTPITQFSAQEMAEGLYYYTSAIGQPITGGPDGNMSDVGRIVSTIMQAGAVSRTGLETVTKGVINAALEFGIDPRDLNNADQIRNIAAQMAWLANVSTLEVPDIAETFKMVGPMAHILSGDKAGSGLNEMFALTYLASEMGIRGGTPGRGVAQGLTSLLDPTTKMIDLAAETWGIEASESAFKAFFFNAEGKLQDGLPGLFEKIGDVAPEKQAAFLAEMFTSNATRAVLGIQEALEKKGGWEAVMKEIAIAGENPLEWLSEAQAETNDTIFANFQNLENAWFATQASIIGTIEGPLKSALRSIAEVLWEVGDIIANNPWIGQLVAGVMAFVGAVATGVGSVLMFGGSILLLLKAFSGLGALAHPAMLFFFSMIRAVLILIPLITALAIVGTLLASAWQYDFMGVRTALTGLWETVREGEVVAQIFDRIGQAIRFTAMAFNEFVVGILAGFGDTAVLGKWLETAFGPILGPFFYSQLLRFSDALEGVRNAIVGFFESISGGNLAGGLRAAIGTIQGFFELLFTGTMQDINVNFAQQLGEALGIEDFVFKLWDAVDSTRQAIAKMVSIVQSLGNALRPVLQDIGEDLREIFDKQTLQDAAQFFESFLKGFATGLLAAGAAAAVFVRTFVDMVAQLGSVGDAIGDFIERTLGVQVTLTSLGETLGLVFGTIIGGLVLRSLIPFATAITGIAVALGVFAVRTIAATGPLLLFVGQIAVATVRVLAFAAAQTVAAVASFLLSTGFGVAVLAVAALSAIIIGAIAYFLGLGQAIDALVAFVQGFLSVIVPVGAAIAFVGYKILEFLANSFGLEDMTEKFRMLGVIVGVGLVTAFIAAAASFIAANLPLILIVAGITALILILNELGLLDDVFNGLVAGFEFVRDAVIDLYNWAKKLFGFLDESESSVTATEHIAKANKMISDREEYVRTAMVALEYHTDVESDPLWYAQAKGATYDKWNRTEGGGYHQVTFGLGETVTFDPIQYERYLADQAKLGGKVTREGGEAFASGVKSEPMDAFKDMVPDWIMNFAESLGIGTEEGFSVDKLIDAVGFETYSKEFQSEIEKATGMTTTDILKREYQQAVNEYEEFMQQAKTKGIVATAQMWKEMGREIPVDPGSYDEWAEREAEAFEDSAQDATDRMRQAIDNMKTQLADAMKSADLGDVLSGIFGDGAGGALTAAEGLFSIGDKIMENIGDKGPWLNMTELLADAAGSGKFLGTDISGQNIHKALEPFLEVVAQQTGVSVNDMMKGIDKYIVPEEFVPIATGELVEGLNQIPIDMYKKIDQLGVGEFTEFGLDWAELVKYGIGQGMADQDWNLADYLASSWDISVAEAERYLMDNGIDPNAVTQEWFDDTQLMIDSMGGQVSVLTEEWWQYLAEKTNNFSTNVIRMTRENFDALPDAVKIGFTNLGYSFVIGAEGSVSSMEYAAETIRQELMNVQQVIDDGIKDTSMTQFWDRLTTDAKDGQQDLEGISYSVEGDMVRIKDSVTGVEIVVPAIQFESFQGSVRDFAEAVEDLEEARKERDRIKGLLEGIEDVPFTGMNFGDLARTGQKSQLLQDLEEVRGTIDELKGLTEGDLAIPDIQGPSEENLAEIKTAVSTAVSDGFTTGASEGVTTAITTLTSDTTAFTTYGQAALAAFVTGFSGGGGTMEQAAPTGGMVQTAGPFDSMFQGYATAAVTAFSTKLDTALQTVWSGLGATEGTGEAGGMTSPFDSQFRGYGTSAATALQTAFDTAMAGWTPSLSTSTAPEPGQLPTGALAGTTPAAASPSTITIKVDLDKSAFESEFANLGAEMLTFTTTTYKAKLSADRVQFAEVYNPVITALNDFTGSPFIATISATRAPADTALNSILQRMNIYADATYEATISASRLPADLALNSILQRLNAYANSTYSATISIVDNASWVIGGVTTALNNLDGKTATTTITTRNVTENITTTSRNAAGGVINSDLQFVGERGMELTALPRGTRVQSSARTANMLRDAVSYAFRSTDQSSPMASAEFRNARQWLVQGAAANKGDVNIRIDNLNIAKDVDVDRAVERIDRLSGRRMEMLRRGMGTFEESRTL